jgi:hypothetical protein
VTERDAGKEKIIYTNTAMIPARHAPEKNDLYLSQRNDRIQIFPLIITPQLQQQFGAIIHKVKLVLTFQQPCGTEFSVISRRRQSDCF